MRQEHECCIVLEVEAVSNYIPIIRICMFQSREKQTVKEIMWLPPWSRYKPRENPLQERPEPSRQSEIDPGTERYHGICPISARQGKNKGYIQGEMARGSKNNNNGFSI